MKHRKSQVILIAMMLSFVLLIPSLAGAQAADEKVVWVAVESEYENQVDNYSAKIIVPKFENMADGELQETLNDSFKTAADELIATFEADLESLKDLPEGDKPHFTVEYNYKTVTDTADVLSVQVYYFSAAGSSMFSASYYNFDKKTSELITLNSLFGENKDYMTILTDYIASEMRRQNESGEGGYWLDNEFGEIDTDEYTQEAFARIEENYQYYLNEDGQVVITFNKYDVAPGAYGSPEFVIPDEVVAEILK